MKNTLLIISCCFVVLGWTQRKKEGFEFKLPQSEMKLVKTGPFLGVEKGTYFTVNFGAERQWQQLKLKAPKTHALNVQFDYNFRQNTMGTQLGYWFKTGRLNLTYGGRVAWCTNFNNDHRFGISPNVGYKFMQAHFQLGVYLLTPDADFKNTNTFYASLRWVFINDRDFRRKKD